MSSTSSSEPSDYFIDEESCSRMSAYLYDQIGRNYACVMQESYFELVGTSHKREVYSSPLHKAAVQIKE